MKIIALEGLDKSGKETQAYFLTQALRSAGYKVVQSECPRYDKWAGKMIRKVLMGELAVTDDEMRKLYEIDRYHMQADFDKWEQEAYDFVVMDRYTMSNMVFQRARGASEIELVWLQHGLRPADLHIILDIPVEESIRRSMVMGQPPDKYEKDRKLLEAVELLYREYAFHGHYYDTGKVVSVDGTGTVRQVHERIKTAVRNGFYLSQI